MIVERNKLSAKLDAPPKAGDKWRGNYSYPKEAAFLFLLSMTNRLSADQLAGKNGDPRRIRGAGLLSAQGSV